MKSAYYSRNNSYSRSANAESAESEDRYPLIRAAAHLGLTAKSFKAGLAAAGITTTEWHHVGKYANRVDYYDVSEASNIIMSSKFWKGAKNRTNKVHCEQSYKEALRRQALVNINTKLFTYAHSTQAHSFNKDIKNKFHTLFLKDICYYLGSRNGISTATYPHRDKTMQCVNYGSHIESSYHFCDHYGNIRERYYDTPITCADGAYIPVFQLSPAGISDIVKKVRAEKTKRFTQRQFNNYNKYSFTRELVKKILNRYVRGAVHCNSLMDCKYGDWLAAANIMNKLYGYEYTIGNGRVTIGKLKTNEMLNSSNHLNGANATEAQ